MGGCWLSAAASGRRWWAMVLTVAARINEYAALGIDSFVLSGYPHLEEAYRVGELLFPHLDVAIPEIPQHNRAESTRRSGGE